MDLFRRERPKARPKRLAFSSFRRRSSASKVFDEEPSAQELVRSLQDAWTRRPVAWERLLTLDRAERTFDKSVAPPGHGPPTCQSTCRSRMSGASMSRSGCGKFQHSDSLSTRPSSQRAAYRPRLDGEVAPGWSLRYCELLGYGPPSDGPRMARRAAVIELPLASDKFCMDDRDNSVFLASSSRGRDARIQRFDGRALPESRKKIRRKAIQADAMTSTRRYINLAFKYMQMKYTDRIDYLKKLFDSKLNKGGNVARPEQYSISNEELKGLATKLGIPEQEVNTLDVQFRHYDYDGSGTLDLEEVRNVFADIGLSPQSREEKCEVTECISEFTQKIGCEEFAFEHFLELLKAVRERVRQVQSIKCWKVFHEADVNGDDSLDMLEVMGLLEGKLGFFLQSKEETTEATSIFAQCDSDGKGALNLDEFQVFVQKVRAKLLTVRRREEVMIAKKFDLEPEIVNEFRSSLPFLWQVFERYCFGRSDQGMRREDLLPFLVDVGGAPSNTEEMQCLPVLDIIKEFAKPFTKFPAALEIVQKARVAVKAALEEELTASFRHYDRDGSGELSMQEIYGILEEFGMLPRTKAEQHEIGVVIEQLDRDGSGSFELLEFHDFFQMMMEQVRLSERKKEHELGTSLGLSDEKLSILRRTWMSLSPRMDGTIPQITMAHCMFHLRQLIDSPLPDEEMRNFMRSVQGAPDLPVDFVDFITTVKNVLLSATPEEEAEDAMRTAERGEKKKNTTPPSGTTRPESRRSPEEKASNTKGP
mmetsp:Transcript_26909/g.62499  ORF Transcript_26909/g.62499 Transcript_26909/m.62499 type:complete len:761 (-) Transcript_26909:226-2508(-)